MILGEGTIALLIIKRSKGNIFAGLKLRLFANNVILLTLLFVGWVGVQLCWGRGGPVLEY